MAGRIVVVGSSNIDLVMKMPRLPKVGETVTDGVFVQVLRGQGREPGGGRGAGGGRGRLRRLRGRRRLRRPGPGSLDAGRDRHPLRLRARRASPPGPRSSWSGGEGQNYIAVAPGSELPPHPRARGPRPRGDRRGGDRDHPVRDPAGDARPRDRPRGGARQARDAQPRPGSPGLARASLARLAYLAVNETEAEFLTGLEVASERDVETAAEALLAKGPKTVVLTLGARGAYVAGDGVRALVPGFAVEAVDTTAAGDVHCGALAVALVEGRPLLEAVALRERGGGALGDEARARSPRPRSGRTSRRSCRRAEAVRFPAPDLTPPSRVSPSAQASWCTRRP